jgi:Fe-Mn family superoxide dismutase
MKALLPYPTYALEPFMGTGAVELHLELHHNYVKTARHLGRKKTLSTTEVSLLKHSENGARLHDLWWEGLRPAPHNKPRRAAAPPRQLLRDLGWRWADLKKALLTAGLSIEGSGWVCLGLKKGKKKAAVHEVANHRFPWSGVKPLLLFDAWEHSYLLDYEADKESYFRGVLAHLVNWDVVADRLEAARG